MKDESLHDIIEKYFQVNLPISGGNGDSFENAIIIETTNSSEGIHMEYEVLKYIHLLGNKSWKRDKQELHKVNRKVYDKLKLVLEDDPDNYHNYYFDITRFYK